MINKQKLWFLTLFSIILVLAVYYTILPESSLSKIIESENKTSSAGSVEITPDDALATLRIADEEEVLSQMSALQETLLDEKTNADDKNNAFEKLKNININKGKEDALETIITLIQDYEEDGLESIAVIVKDKEKLYELSKDLKKRMKIISNVFFLSENSAIKNLFLEVLKEFF